MNWKNKTALHGLLAALAFFGTASAQVTWQLSVPSGVSYNAALSNVQQQIEQQLSNFQSSGASGPIRWSLNLPPGLSQGQIQSWQQQINGLVQQAIGGSVQWNVSGGGTPASVGSPSVVTWNLTVPAGASFADALAAVSAQVQQLWAQYQQSGSGAQIQWTLSLPAGYSPAQSAQLQAQINSIVQGTIGAGNGGGGAGGSLSGTIPGVGATAAPPPPYNIGATINVPTPPPPPPPVATLPPLPIVTPPPVVVVPTGPPSVVVPPPVPIVTPPPVVVVPTGPPSVVIPPPVPVVTPPSVVLPPLPPVGANVSQPDSSLWGQLLQQYLGNSPFNFSGVSFPPYLNSGPAGIFNFSNPNVPLGGQLSPSSLYPFYPGGIFNFSNSPSTAYNGIFGLPYQFGYNYSGVPSSILGNGVPSSIFGNGASISPALLAGILGLPGSGVPGAATPSGNISLSAPYYSNLATLLAGTAPGSQLGGSGAGGAAGGSGPGGFLSGLLAPFVNVLGGGNLGGSTGNIGAPSSGALGALFGSFPGLLLGQGGQIQSGAVPADISGLFSTLFGNPNEFQGLDVSPITNLLGIQGTVSPAQLRLILLGLGGAQIRSIIAQLQALGQLTPILSAYLSGIANTSQSGLGGGLSGLWNILLQEAYKPAQDGTTNPTTIYPSSHFWSNVLIGFFHALQGFTQSQLENFGLGSSALGAAVGNAAQNFEPFLTWFSNQLRNFGTAWGAAADVSSQTAGRIGHEATQGVLDIR